MSIRAGWDDKSVLCAEAGMRRMPSVCRCAWGTSVSGTCVGGCDGLFFIRVVCAEWSAEAYPEQLEMEEI